MPKTNAVLGVDPGGTTGIALLDAGELKVLGYEQIPSTEPVWLREWVRKASWVFVERYTISPGTVTRTRQSDAMYITGMLKLICAEEGRIMRLVNRSDSKHAFSNEALRELGLFNAVVGPHARDALRCALLGSRLAGYRVHTGVQSQVDKGR